MKPIKFDRQNSKLITPKGMTNAQCGDLPAYKTGIDIYSCWKMGLRERIAGLFFGRVWVRIRAGTTHPPIALSCKKTFFEKEKE